MSVQLKFDRQALGWASFVFDDGGGPRTITCSYIHDTLGDLIRGLALTRPGTRKQVVPATDEERSDVEMSIRSINEEIEFVAKRRLDFAAKPNWKTVFRIRDSRAAVLSVFATAFRAAIEPLGAEGYLKAWGRPLPVAEFESLMEFAG